MRSPYDILGVKREAGEDEIRKAFRKLAKQWHPDMRPDDTQAESRFKEINAAYDLLTDPARRARFDRGEIDADGREQPRTEHAFNGGGNPFQGRAQRQGPGGFRFEFGGGAEGVEDIVSELFGQRFGQQRTGKFHMRGEDRRHAVTVDFLDAVNGATRRMSLPGGRSLDVTISPGLKDGQTLRLKGQGDPGLGGGTPGDLLLEVHVAPHRLFKRVGDDIHLDIPITLVEAIDGGRITVPTVTGQVTVTVPRHANTGTVLRLKGKGIKGGDQYVTLKVTLPAEPDDELARLVRDWSLRHPYDPRAGL
jgi:DnaJ-class molecular chaperone